MQVDVESFEERGYAIVSGLFSNAEVVRLRQHYMDVRQSGSHPGDLAASI